MRPASSAIAPFVETGHEPKEALELRYVHEVPRLRLAGIPQHGFEDLRLQLLALAHGIPAQARKAVAAAC